MITYHHRGASEAEKILIEDTSVPELIFVIEDDYYRSDSTVGTTNLYIHNRLIGKTYEFSIFKADKPEFDYRVRFPDRTDYIHIKTFDEFRDLIGNIMNVHSTPQTKY